jgi:hypothetical protein
MLESGRKKVLVKNLACLSTAQGQSYFHTYVKPHIAPPFDAYYSPEFEWELKRLGYNDKDTGTYTFLSKEGFGYILSIDLIHKKQGDLYEYIFPFEVEFSQATPSNFPISVDELTTELHLLISLYDIQEKRIVYQNTTKTNATPIGIPTRSNGQLWINPIGLDASYRKSLRKGLKRMIRYGYLTHSQRQLLKHLSTQEF